MFRYAFIAAALFFLAPQTAQATLAAMSAQQPSPAEKPKSAIGYWEGSIKIPGMDLQIQVNFEQASGNALQGTISVPMQNMVDHKLEAITVALPEISFKMPGLPGDPTFKGRIEGDAIKGDYTQGGQSFLFELKRGVKPAEVIKVFSEQEIEAVAGYWEGNIQLPNQNMGMEINIEQTNDKTLQGTISIHSGGIKDRKLVDIAVELPEITFKPAGIPISIKGRVEGDAIKGDFAQPGAAFPFELKRAAKPVLTEAALPNGLSERDITIGNSPFELPGTLTLPAGRGSFPAAVIVHGSGPNNRNGDLPNAPDGAIGVYKDLAWRLAERGIAVIRYDKRTLVYGARIAAAMKTITLNEITVDDAALAVSAALRIPEIDFKKVFVIGHSKGGYALGRIADKAPSAAGFVAFAGGALPLYEILPEQYEYLGAAEAEIKKINEQSARVRSGNFTANTPNSELPIWPASFWLDLRGYDAVASLRKSGRPALILQGESDYQVTMKDCEAWKKGFPEATFKSFPKLDHLFCEVEGKSTPAEYLRPGRKIDPDVTKTIADWIKTKG
jgi:dienelactone hydrolase